MSPELRPHRLLGDAVEPLRRPATLPCGCRRDGAAFCYDHRPIPARVGTRPSPATTTPPRHTTECAANKRAYLRGWEVTAKLLSEDPYHGLGALRLHLAEYNRGNYVWDPAEAMGAGSADALLAAWGWA